MNKRILASILLSGVLLLSACSNDTTDVSASPDEVLEQGNDKLSIVATSFHEYDWVNQILGENNEIFEVTLLMDNGVDLHSYEPSVEDISIISSADLFIYNGGPSHDWVIDILEEPMNENLKAIEVMASLGDAVKAEVNVEGMQADSAHAHSHDHAEHEEEAHAEAMPHEDEHVWLSLNNAITICQIIEDEISSMDPENEKVYQQNVDNYIATLNELDESFKIAINESPRDTLVFADRFPFLYLMQDYDVNYYAAFQGCSAETEANFETIVFLSDKVNELDINNLLILENGLVELAETVNNNSEDKDSNILELDSIQSVSNEEIEAGITYYSIMESNLEILKTALGE